MWLQNSCHMRSAACRVYFKFKRDLKNWNKLVHEKYQNYKIVKTILLLSYSKPTTCSTEQNPVALRWQATTWTVFTNVFDEKGDDIMLWDWKSWSTPPQPLVIPVSFGTSLGRVIETHKVPFSVPTHQMALWLRLGTNTTWLGTEDWWRLVELRHQTSFHTGHKHQSSGSRCDPPLNPYLHPLLGPSCFYSCRCSDRLILTHVFALEVVWSPVRLVRLVRLDEMQRDMTEYNKFQMRPSSPLLT